MWHLACKISMLHLNYKSDLFILTQVDNSLGKQADIVKEVVRQINLGCNCGLTTDYITDERFQCNPDEDDQATFRARLFGTCTYNNETFIGYLNRWVRTIPTIVILGVEYSVDENCHPVNVSSFNELYCRTVSSAAVVAGVSSGIIVGVIIFVAMLIVVIVVIVVTRRARIKYNAGDGYVFVFLD